LKQNWHLFETKQTELREKFTKRNYILGETKQNVVYVFGFVKPTKYPETKFLFCLFSGLTKQKKSCGTGNPTPMASVGAGLRLPESTGTVLYAV
jgi:hypothetical protein